MIKALLKKQWLEYSSFFTQGKDGKPRKRSALIGFAVLILYGLGAMGASFYLMAQGLCEPLVMADMAWLYFSLMAVYAAAFGIMIVAFSTKVKLYEAKDNDLLFSMPIPAHIVLFTRILGLYLFTLLIECMVLVPAMVEYFLVAGFSVWSVIGCLGVLAVAPLFALGIGALLGLGLAWITARLPFKNLFTLLSVALFAVGYTYLTTNFSENLGTIILQADGVGGVMNTALYPFAKLGYAAEGDMLALALSVLIFGGAFALIYLLLSKTYFKIATMKRGERKAKYKEKTARIATPMQAFFKKELFQLIKNPMYLLNASMGTILALVGAVAVLVTGGFFGLDENLLAMMPDMQKSMGLLVCVMVCFMASSNTMAAASVSLEGEKIWIPQSLPIGEWAVLKAKLFLHFIMTAIPTLVLAVCLGISFDLHIAWIGAGALTAILASALFASMDLAINLKFPSLRWTNEMAAYKQSASIVIAMFGGWGIALLPVGLYFLFGKYLPAWAFACICLGLIVVAVIALFVWLKQRGTKIFRGLSV
ncbi:MAG: hypothetical protein IKB20_00830 [Clostridia bacterium]|nr:hypothetical protein [Clostridia bacterium]